MITSVNSRINSKDITPILQVQSPSLRNEIVCSQPPGQQVTAAQIQSEPFPRGMSELLLTSSRPGQAREAVSRVGTVLFFIPMQLRDQLFE